MKLKPRNHTARGSLVRRLVAGATLATFVATPPSALAALTDVANSPISSAATTTIPPNILFILDGSGSMDSDYMPDSASSFSGDVGGKNHLCNTIYYNPAISYVVPKNSDGTDFAAPSFTNAKNDGFSSNSPSGSSDLSSSFKANSSTNSEQAYYYKWKGAAPPTNGDCNVDDSTSYPHTPGSWDKVRIGAAEQQNFANWYTFYRTRLSLMKTAAGLAFAGLNDSFRVGFITICPDGSSCNNDSSLISVNANYYLKIDNFTPSHKAAWYAKFYQQQGSSFTPLRQALARAGRHFAGKTDGINAGMNDDPVQFSCQQNFAILTTDGYWNYGKGKQLNGTTDIGAQDQNLGLTPRPMFDGGPVTSTTVTTNDQQWYDRWRNNSSNCNGIGNGFTRWYRRTQTITTTVSQGGAPSTSTNYSSTSTTNGCFQDATLPTSWTTYNTTTSGGGTSASGGIANTLSDVAEYYYRTDLRPTGSLNALGVDVSTDNVPQTGTGVEDDKARHQHMTTFTLGLGVSGQLAFQDDYKNASTGDFQSIRGGSMGWPDPNPGSPNGGSSAENAARIDDLWHAAVNGRGTAYSATDPVTLAVALKTALSAIQAKLSSAAAAATSSLEPTVTDRLAFTPTYVTADWTGELEAFRINLSTGALEPNRVWSAKDKLNARTDLACDSRNIYLFKPGATPSLNTLVDFTWNTFKCDSAGVPTGTASNGLDATDQAYFAPTKLTSLTQWGFMTDGTSGTVDQRGAAGGAGLVNYLRGQRGMGGFAPNDLTKLYRARKHVLGDIVNATPVYVRQPYFDYTDDGYATFKSTSAAASRLPVVFVGGNDGMLHAFNGSDDAMTGGEELWAYVPRMVLPNLSKLADTNWANLHEYTVDATATVGDVDVGPAGTPDWRTIAVAGLNKGGRGFYALDVTDPNTPKALWEFTLPAGATAGSCSSTAYADCDLGYSFGNPIISKLADGRWVVFVTSGHNNVSPGSGEGYLYVLSATTGQILYKIPTGKGNTTTPSGLTKIRNWVSGNAAQNNTTDRVYGVDILGNVWRFDVNDNFGNTGREATLLATLLDPGGNPQPITTRPELAETGSPPAPYVYVATGRYLAGSDVSNTQVQSLYAIRDALDPTVSISNPRLTFRNITMTATGQERYAECVDPLGKCTSNDGWYTDWPVAGERVNVDMKLQLGAVVIASNVPANTACEPGGTSYISAFNFKTGLAAAGVGKPVGKFFSSALAVGINIIRLPDGKVVVIGMDSSGTPQIADVNIDPASVSGQRVTWREIAD
jgi:type IV pilus assembly protein PilY1